MKFIPYVCCGDPNIEFTYELVKRLAKYADIIELGIPFSDPIADGKTIQKAANRALKNGVTLEKIFEMVKKLRSVDRITVPFVFMTYYNIVYAYGKENFLKKMNNVGVEGLIIPDLPFGEDKEFEKIASGHGITIVNLIAQNTEEDRAKRILKKENMFTYLVSVKGVTGVRGEISEESLEFVKRIQTIAGKENTLCVGFGISTIEQAKQFVDAGADGVIVGSKIVDIYSSINERDNALEEIEKFANGFKQ